MKFYSKLLKMPCDTCFLVFVLWSFHCCKSQQLINFDSKQNFGTQEWCPRPVIPATEEAEAEGLQIWDQPGQLTENLFLKGRKRDAVVQHLLTVCKGLGFNPQYLKTNNYFQMSPHSEVVEIRPSKIFQAILL